MAKRTLQKKKIGLYPSKKENATSGISIIFFVEIFMVIGAYLGSLIGDCFLKPTSEEEMEAYQEIVYQISNHLKVNSTSLVFYQVETQKDQQENTIAFIPKDRRKDTIIFSLTNRQVAEIRKGDSIPGNLLIIGSIALFAFIGVLVHKSIVGEIHDIKEKREAKTHPYEFYR